MRFLGTMRYILRFYISLLKVDFEIYELTSIPSVEFEPTEKAIKRAASKLLMQYGFG